MIRSPLRLSSHPRAASALRFGEGLVLLASAAVLVLYQAQYRHLEAVLASVVFGHGGVRTFTTPDTAIVVFRIGETMGYGLEISPECTSAFLILPFVVVAAAIRLGGRVAPGRALGGVALVAVLLVACNQLRVGMIAGLIQNYGLDVGYQWGHLLLGSLLSIAFLALSAAVLLYVVAFRQSRRPRAVATP